MSYDEWFRQYNTRVPGKKYGYVDTQEVEPIHRDERGLVTPTYCAPSSTADSLRIKATLHNVSEDDFLRKSCEALCKRGSWCKYYDCFSYVSFGGLRQTLVMSHDGQRRWVTTKTRWDPTHDEAAFTARWRCRGV